MARGLVKASVVGPDGEVLSPVGADAVGAAIDVQGARERLAEILRGAADAKAVAIVTYLETNPRTAGGNFPGWLSKDMEKTADWYRWSDAIGFVVED